MYMHTHNPSFYLYLLLLTGKPDEWSAEGRRPACYLKFQRSVQQRDTLFMKHMLFYFFFFEVATTRFMGNVKENASRVSSSTEENHPNLRTGFTTQFSPQPQLPFGTQPMILPPLLQKKFGLLSMRYPSPHLVTHLCKCPAPHYFFQSQMALFSQ